VLLKRVELNRGLLEWSSPASEMLAKLTRSLDRRIAKSLGWPKTPTTFSNELRRLAPTLAENGLSVVFKRNRNMPSAE
jgi:hypothetical protein